MSFVLSRGTAYAWVIAAWVGQHACLLDWFLVSHVVFLWWSGTPHPPLASWEVVVAAACGLGLETRSWCSGHLFHRDLWGWVVPHPPLAFDRCCWAASTPPHGVYVPVCAPGVCSCFLGYVFWQRVFGDGGPPPHHPAHLVVPLALRAEAWVPCSVGTQACTAVV